VFLIQDVTQETNYLSCSPKVRSEIVMPIFSAGKVVGEIGIDSHALAPFTENDRHLLEAIAERVSQLLDPAAES
jgi:GAF domain-containing protein